MENDFLDKIRKAVKYWWVSLLVGIVSIVVGIWSLTDPLTTFFALTVVFIAGFLINGIFEIVFAVSNKDTLSGWGWTLSIGIIDILFGILLMANMQIAPEILALFIGFWLLFQAFWGIGISVDLSRYKNSGWGWLLAFAIIGLILSIFLIAQPIVAGYFATIFVGSLFIIYGIFRIFLSLKLKSLKND